MALHVNLAAGFLGSGDVPADVSGETLAPFAGGAKSAAPTVQSLVGK
jgi:hypothetical protein